MTLTLAALQRSQGIPQILFVQQGKRYKDKSIKKLKWKD